MVSPKIHAHSELQNVISYGNRAFKTDAVQNWSWRRVTASHCCVHPASTDSLLNKTPKISGCDPNDEAYWEQRANQQHAYAQIWPSNTHSVLYTSLSHGWRLYVYTGTGHKWASLGEPVEKETKMRAERTRGLNKNVDWWPRQGRRRWRQESAMGTVHTEQ